MNTTDRKVREFVARKLGVNPDGPLGRRIVDAYIRKVERDLQLMAQ